MNKRVKIGRSFAEKSNSLPQQLRQIKSMADYKFPLRESTLMRQNSVRQKVTFSKSRIQKLEKDLILQANKLLKFKKNLEEKSCFSENLKKNYYKSIKNIQTHRIQQIHKSIELENHQININRNMKKQENFKLKNFEDILNFRKTMLKEREQLNAFKLWEKKLEKLNQKKLN